MTERREQRRAEGLSQVCQTLVSGKVLYISLLMLFVIALSLPLAHASSLPVNVYVQNSVGTMIFPFTVTVSACTANFLGGSCSGTDIISGTANQTLTSDIFVQGNIIISSGANVIPNGFAMVASGNIVIKGTIRGKWLGNGAPQAIQPPPGGSIITSYGGSGGSGGGQGSYGGSIGGNTLVPGGGLSGLDHSGYPGSTPASPTITATNINLWHIEGFDNYLSGAGGGGGGNGDQGGGAGSEGCYLQANNIIGTGGAINVNGFTSNTGSIGAASGGGGGGGICIEVYQSSLIATHNAISGGIAANTLYPGGNGGNGNVISIQMAYPPLGLPVQYPIQIYTSDTSISYTLNAISGSTQTTLQTGNAISYVPPASQPSGLYVFNVVEYNGVATQTVQLNLSVSMADISGPLAFNGICSNPSQYFTNCANVPTWNANPSRWEILGGTLPQPNTIGANNIDYFSNRSKSFLPILQLTYNGFTPAITFTANSLNNPALTSITQSGFAITLTNTPLSSNRTVAQFNVFSQYTFNAVNTTLSILVNGTFNGYSVNGNAIATGNSVYYMQIPNSIYNNNPAFIYSLNDSASTSLYYAHYDTYCTANSNQTNPYASYPIGMVDTNGSKYSFYVYTSGGGSAAGYIMQVLEQKGVGSTAVQSFLIPAQLPFVLALEATGQNYAYNIYNKECTQLFYKGSFTTPTNPVYLSLNNSGGGFVLNVTKVNGLCKVNSLTSNTYYITCEAGDSSNNAYEYKLYVYKIGSAFGGTDLVYNYTALGSSFIVNFTLPAGPPILQYSATIYAYVYQSYDPILSIWSYLLNGTQPASLAPSLLGLIAFIIMLMLILGGAATGKITVLLALANVGVFLIGILNLIQVPLEVEIFFIVVSCAAIWWDRRGKQ